ncbi:DUF4855 domain-containing protein [Aestuariibacter sp. AA17]|uniref:DUF4855 domain-containing protein n=1 Tax=Fluctibacter corallii TaxID=2984329 RepID=A0ABT3ABY7_9ALTE|nr:DUF4855 domain-containing protein [Aestuariibacter sp. AA17]MCV2886200.1 DUF4855 domain-containing protein [Aestuariibacter sp. AA17]
MKYSLVAAALFGFSAFSAISSPVSPDNTYLFYAKTGTSEVLTVSPSEQREFFKRMLSYVDENGQPVDAFMDAMVMMESVRYFSTGGNLGTCTSETTCSRSVRMTNYIDEQFRLGGYLDVLKQAESDVNQALGSTYQTKVPSISVYFAIPYPKTQAVSANGTHNPHYLKEFNEYMRAVYDEFQNWKARNNNSAIEMAGFYFARESIKVDGGNQDLLRNDGSAQSDTFLFNLKASLNTISPSMSLISSPYQNYYASSGGLSMYTAYQGKEEGTFGGAVQTTSGSVLDSVYLQPNAFHGGFKWKDVVDKEVIKWTYNFYNGFNNIAFNIETNGYQAFLNRAQDKEFFPEIINYADYDRYLGLHQFPIMYYDSARTYYDLSLSPTTHWMYKEAYLLSKRAREGYIVNGGFEHFDLVSPSGYHVGYNSTILSDYNPSSLFGWTTNGTFSQNNHIDIANYQFITAGSERPVIGNAPLVAGKYYRFRFDAKESSNDGQTYSGIAVLRFYDKDGNSITSGDVGTPYLKYSSYVNGWYQYIATSTTTKHIAISFKPPIGSVNTEFVLGKWSGSASINWNNVSVQEPVSTYPAYVFGKTSQGVFAKNDLLAFSQAAKLNKSQFVESERALPIHSGVRYQLRFESQLTSGTNCSSYNGVAGIKFYDQHGNLMSSSASGLTWSSFLGLHYQYFLASSDKALHSYSFTPPAGATEAKVHLRNWYCSGDVLVDNVKLADTLSPETDTSFSGEPVAIDQAKLIRLSDDNNMARFIFDLSGTSNRDLQFLSRVNCERFNDTQCQSDIDIDAIYLDASGKIMEITQSTLKGLGAGEQTPKSTNGLLTYSSWQKQTLRLNSAGHKAIVTFRKGNGSKAKALLINRPHLK